MKQQPFYHAHVFVGQEFRQSTVGVVSLYPTNAWGFRGWLQYLKMAGTGALGPYVWVLDFAYS